MSSFITPNKHYGTALIVVSDRVSSNLMGDNITLI